MAKEALECEGFVWSEEDEMARGSDEAWTALATVCMPASFTPRFLKKYILTYA